MPHDALDPQSVASTLAMRLCHDFVSPAGAVVSGLDLLAASPTGELKDAAMEMVNGSGRKLLALILFSRVAFGAGDEDFDTGALEVLARGLFGDLRSTLDWSVEATSLAGPAARILLNLAQIAADALPFGGVARTWAERRGGKTHLGVDALNARIKHHPGVMEGLNGAPPGEAMKGRWVQAYFVHALVAAAGGEVTIEIGEAGIRFTAVLP